MPGSVYSADDSLTNHASSSYVPKLTVSDADVGGTWGAGDYLIIASAAGSCNVAGRALDDAFALIVDGVVVAGRDLYVTSGGGVYMPFWAVKRVTLTAGSHTVRISTRATGAGENIYIHSARILIFWSLSGLQYAEADTVSALPVGSGPTKKVALSFVPRPGPYLVLASWEQISGAGGSNEGSRLLEGHTVLMEHEGSDLYNHYLMHGACAIRDLAPTTIRYTIDHSTAFSANPDGLRRSRIAAFPLTDNDAVALGSTSLRDDALSQSAYPGTVVLSQDVGNSAAGGFLLFFIQAAVSTNGGGSAFAYINQRIDGAVKNDFSRADLSDDKRAEASVAGFWGTGASPYQGVRHEAALAVAPGTFTTRATRLTLSAMSFGVPVTVTVHREPVRSWPTWLVSIARPTA